jgi:hypothetical protein
MATDYSGYFDQVLTTYRTNMATYKMTGSAAAKTAADNAKGWAVQYLNWMEGTVSANSEYINRFVGEYARTNPELVAMQAKMKTIKTEGPRLENVYQTDKEAAETSPRDFTPYYIKGGVILGVVALVAVLSF